LGQALEISLASTTAINVFDGTVYSFSPSGVVRKGIDPQDVETVDHSPVSYYAGKVYYRH
jgi:hypothetical protein